jgi:hypothetical protein
MSSIAMPAPPWYRQAWPWFLISLPATAVVAGLVTFYLAARGWDGPVARDYYRQGLAINEELTRVERARALGVGATVRVGGLAVGETVRVEVAAAQPLPPEAALRLMLVHPGRRDADRVAILARVDVSDDGRRAIYAGTWQQGEADTRAPSVTWQAALETRQWRIDDVVTTRGAGEFGLRAR